MSLLRRYRLVKFSVFAAMVTTIILIVMVVMSPLTSPGSNVDDDQDYMYVAPAQEAEIQMEKDIEFENNKKQRAELRAERRARKIEVDRNAVDEPGDMGKPVFINPNVLSAEDRRLYDDGWKNNSFNQFASDMISLHRRLPGVREEECYDMISHSVSEMPNATVIIVFHNEAWSTLLRTVHSVLDRSPPSLIAEIILVDDFSTMEHLHQPLDDYVAKLEKVKLARQKSREGLIRARLLGADMAQGSVLVFLDSHCEAVEGWLEYLVDPLVNDRTTVTVPLIDIIDEKTLEFRYISANNFNLGGFGWNMMFEWHPAPRPKTQGRYKHVMPVQSPTMAGGLFAMDKKYFYELGAYDKGMEIWGGENLEISFRIWMCGGTLLTVPCAHVGHIYRDTTPYKFAKPGGSEAVIRRNRVRMAEVWMDDYKYYFYHFHIANELGEYGDVSERQQLRQRLKCKSFGWYLHNIFPDMFIPQESLAVGQVWNPATNLCLDSRGGTDDAIDLQKCHGQGGNQMFFLSAKQEVRIETLCMFGDKYRVYLSMCDPDESSWEYREDGTLTSYGQCLTVTGPSTLSLSDCQPHDRYQQWVWDRTNGTWQPS